MKKTYLTFSFAAIFALAIAVPLAVSAQSGDRTPTQTTSSTPETQSEAQSSTQTANAAEVEHQREATLEKARENAKAHLEEARTEVKQKLETKRLAVCNERTGRINSLLKNNSSRSQTTLSRFESVVQRVEAFKTSHNLTVPNYSALLADVASKEAAATAALGSVSGTTFNCDHQDATKVVGTFQTGVIKTELNALKEYRTSIKKLIAAVKQAAELNVKTPSTTGGN